MYQGSIPAKGVCLVAESKEDVAGCFSITDDPGEAQELNSASPLSVNDTLYDPLDKTPAEKEAYLQAMMDEVMRMKPYKVRRDRGPSSNYAVGEVPLSYGVSNSGGRLFLVWNSQLLV